MATAAILAGAAAVAEAAVVCAAAAHARRSRRAGTPNQPGGTQPAAAPSAPPPDNLGGPEGGLAGGLDGPNGGLAGGLGGPDGGQATAGAQGFEPDTQDFEPDMPVVLKEKLKLFMNIAAVDFGVTMSLIVTGNLSAMPIPHGAHVTHELPCCIFVGWCPRPDTNHQLQHKGRGVGCSGSGVECL